MTLSWHYWYELYVLSEWIIRLVMLVYVPHKRPPGAARAWLLLIFVLPWPGLLIYSILGKAGLSPSRAQRQALASERIRKVGRAYFERYFIHPQLEETFHPTVHLAECLGDFGIVRGNQLELLPEYEPAIDRLVADIDAARHHVHLLYYIFADDTTGRRVARALIAATERGVSCRLLVDSLGSHDMLDTLAPTLREAGVEVIPVLPLNLFGKRASRIDLRNHRKIVVIDGTIGYVGSQNIVDPTFKAGIIYEELVVRIVGPVVLELQAVILADRFFETDHLLSEPSLFPDQEADGHVAAQILPSGPGYIHANNQRLIVSLVHAAQRRIVITTPYFVPDETLTQALQTAALRGVEVHLIVSQIADQWLVGLAQRSFYEELLDAGIHVHRYRSRFLHAKHLTFDDTVCLVGSSNIDIRSFQLNAEILLVVYDADVGARFRALQERTIAESETLDLERWSRRPWWVQAPENIARLVDSLL